MSDRRQTRLSKGYTGGGDPDFAGDEEYTVTVNGWGKRAFSMRCDVNMPLVASEETTFGSVLSDDVESEFVARLSIYGWNGQEIIDDYAAIKQSREEYVALDVAGEFITEED